MSRLLVVDDSPTVLQFLQMVFESEKFEVSTAADGAEALAKVYQWVPDAVVTDSLMPGMDGCELLGALRGDPRTEMIPVIMLTSGDPGALRKVPGVGRVPARDVHPLAPLTRLQPERPAVPAQQPVPVDGEAWERPRHPVDRVLRLHVEALAARQSARNL